jgi:hypothetical protein
VNPTTNKSGVYYWLSDDLINWSDPQLIVEPDSTGACESPMHYTTLLDPTDPAAAADPTLPDTLANPNDLNFDHPGRRPQIWFHQRHLTGSGCTEPNQNDVDLAYMPIQFEQKQATLESGGLTDADRGYSSTAANFTLQTGLDYGSDPGNNYANATQSVDAGSRWAYGRHNVNWHDGDEVWYGSAFKLPTNVASANDRVDLMTWRSTGASQGGIILNSADRFELMYQPPTGTRSTLGPQFDLPTGRWVWVEVHQKLGSSNALNEVYVDGRLVVSTTTPNHLESSNVNLMRYGIINNTSTSGGPTSVDVDRSSVMGGQLGAVIGAGNFEAPKTPLGFRQVFTTTSLIGLTWNAPQAGEPPVTGWRIYEQASDGTWGKVADNTSGGTILGVPDQPCATHVYRITAHRAFADPLNPESTNSTESIVSSPLVVRTAGCS